MENPLWFSILCWFFVTTVHQYIIIMFLITTKQVQILWKFQLLTQGIYEKNSPKSDSRAM